MNHPDTYATINWHGKSYCMGCESNEDIFPWICFEEGCNQKVKSTNWHQHRLDAHEIPIPDWAKTKTGILATHGSDYD